MPTPAPIVSERVQSRRSTSGSNPTEERLYLVQNVIDDEPAARALVADFAPVAVDGQALNEAPVSLRRISIDLQPLGVGMYDARVDYAAVAIDAGDLTTSFRTTGGTQHILSSLLTRTTYAAPGITPIDYHGLLNVDDNNDVQGTDINVPVFEWTERHIKSPTEVNAAYIGKLYALTPRVNSTAFRIRLPNGGSYPLAAGECLFIGAAGEQRQYDNWALEFAFAASPNVNDLRIGSIQGIVKRGWDYLWSRFRKTTNGSLITLTPEAVYVEQVYREGDLSQLNLGP